MTYEAPSPFLYSYGLSSVDVLPFKIEEKNRELLSNTQKCIFHMKSKQAVLAQGWNLSGWEVKVGEL